MRQLLTESLLVAAAGAGLGILLADLGTRLLVALVSTGVSDFGLQVPRDSRVFLFTAAITLVTAILFGLAPAFRATRLDVSRTLAANARGTIGGRGRARTGRVLAIAQVALSVILLLGAALFVRSLTNLLNEDLGYNHDHLLMLRVDQVSAGYSGANVTRLYARVLEGLRGVPGVRSATISNTGLFSWDSGDHLAVEGSPVRDPGQRVSRWTEIGPDYFRTLGIPVLEGREITRDDAARGTPVCVVNESFARRFYPDANPIGRHIIDLYPTTIETFEIVGVVGNAKEHRANEETSPRFYSNLAHPIGGVDSAAFLVRTEGDPASVGASVRQAIRRIDPNLPVLRMLPVNEQIDRRLTTDRLVAQLAGFFGALALFMAAIGLYGVMSYSISRRTSEIGIRMALGASGKGISKMVLGETMRIVAIGVGIGLPCALALGRLVASRLYGLSAADPTAISAAVSIIVITAALAGYVPARRAARIDPSVSLRWD